MAMPPVSSRPYVDKAVRVLSDILTRMEKHHYKKRSLFRKLRVSALPGDSGSRARAESCVRPHDAETAARISVATQAFTSEKIAP